MTKLNKKLQYFRLFLLQDYSVSGTEKFKKLKREGERYQHTYDGLLAVGLNSARVRFVILLQSEAFTGRRFSIQIERANFPLELNVHPLVP